MIALVVAVLVTATQSPHDATPAAKMRLAMGTFHFVGLSNELQVFLPEHLAQQLQSRGVEVISSEDIKTLLGRERQRELLGCNEDSVSCQAELIGALGAEGIVVGEIAQLGGLFQVNMKIISGVTGHPMATFSTRVEKERDLLEAIDRGAMALSQTVVPSHNASLPLDDTIEPEPTVIVTTPMSRRSWSLVPAIAGVVIGAAGGVMLGLAKVNHDALARRNRTTPLDTETALTTAERGASYQTLGLIGLGVGGAALIGAALLFVFGKPAEVDTIRTSLVFATSGASVSVGGSFP